MKTLTIVIFVFQAINSTIAQPQEQLDFAGGKCRQSQLVDPDSKYQQNVLSLFSKLLSLSSQRRFSMSSSGLGPDEVNGFYLCRPDLSLSTCHTCINSTIGTYHQYCFSRKEAAIWYDECMIQYTNRSVSPAIDSEPLYFDYSAFNVSEPQRFPALLNATMLRLISIAVSPNNTQRFFASGVAEFTLFEGFHGMVFCRPDITAADCKDCLTTLLATIPSCCGGFSLWTTISQPKCQLRYDTAPLIIDPPSPSSSSTHAPEPSTEA